MTSPREQAIEEAAKAICTLVHERVVDWDALPKDERDNYSLLARAAIVKYEQARARLDGAKMMPREATPEPIKWPPADHPHCQAGRDGECFWPHCPQAVDHKKTCPLYDPSREGD
jgi:hypothetical protein